MLLSASKTLSPSITRTKLPHIRKRSLHGDDNTTVEATITHFTRIYHVNFTDILPLDESQKIRLTTTRPNR